MKIVTVVGARPQFIKCAPVSRALRKVATEILVHTGQHYDDNMSAVFFKELEIPEPDYNLGVGSGPQGQQTGEMLRRIEETLLKEQPDVVLVYGDTNSTLAGALAATKLHIRVAHVEAGLRSFNKRMPEEINRVLTDHVSDLLFCPTETAAINLERESIKSGVHLVGDVMYDSFLHYVESAGKSSTVLERLSLASKCYALATVHRAENTDDPKRLRSIFEALQDVSRDLPVIVPLHPRTRRQLHDLNLSSPALMIIDPIPYLDMLVLENNARVILTDSGGVQKEAYWLGVLCITLRHETEWTETVQSGWNVLAGSDPTHVIEVLRSMSSPPSRPRFHGDGKAAMRCVDVLVQGNQDG